MAKAKLKCECGGMLFVVPKSNPRYADRFIYRKRICVACSQGYETREERVRVIALTASQLLYSKTIRE